MVNQVAVYKGDELLVTGSIVRCAAYLGVKIDTIYFYMSPAYKKRIAKRKQSLNSTVAFKIEEE